MGANIQVYRSIVRTLGGTPKNYGNIQTPYSDFDTGSTTGAAHDDSVPVVAGATVTLWDYSTSAFKDWSVGLVEVVGTGTLYLAWKNDTATSASNNDPTGSAKTWGVDPITEKAPFFFPGRAAITNANAVDHVSDNSGTPTAFSDPGEVAGYIYKIQVKNPGTTDMRVRCVLLG